MFIYIVEEHDYNNWHSSISYTQHGDPKGYEGVKYIRSSRATITFPKNISKVSFHESKTSSDVIIRVTGEKPSFYSKLDLEREMQLSNSNHY